MIFELTGDYRLTIAVLVAVVVATVLTRVFHGPSYFLNMLSRRGLELRGGHDVGTLTSTQAGDLMREDHLVMEATEGLPALRENLLRAPHGEVFVQSDGVFFGRLMLADLGELAYDPTQDDGRDVGALVSTHELFVFRDTSLQEVVELFSSTEDSLLAVLDDPTTRRLVGCLHERDVMRAEGAYAKTLERLRAEEH